MKSLSYRIVVKKLRKCGFVFRRRTSGTHEIWWNDMTRKTCVVPHHHEIQPGTLRSIIKQAGLSEKEFLVL